MQAEVCLVTISAQIPALIKSIVKLYQSVCDNQLYHLINARSVSLYFLFESTRMHKVFENSKPPRVDSLLKQVAHGLIIRNLNNGTWTGIGCITAEFRAIEMLNQNEKWQ